MNDYTMINVTDNDLFSSQRIPGDERLSNQTLWWCAVCYGCLLWINAVCNVISVVPLCSYMKPHV